MKKNLYYIIFCFAFLSIGGITIGQDRLLFVGNGTSTEDVALTTFLGMNNWLITSVDATTFRNNYVTADIYSSFDVVYISESVGSGDLVAFATAGFPIPCVTTEGYAVRTNRWGFITNDDTEFHQSGSTERTDGVKALIINNVEQYITSAYEENATVFWTTAEVANLGVTGCKLDQTMQGVIKLATYNDPVMSPFPTLWAIPAGSVVTAGSKTIPVNIVIFGAILPGMGTGATDDFNSIIQKSLEWASGRISSLEKFGSREQNGLSLMPNPTRGIVNVSFTLSTPEIVKINIYDITGKIIESLESGYLNAGPNNIELDLTDKADAQYIIRLITDNCVLTGKICKN